MMSTLTSLYLNFKLLLRFSLSYIKLIIRLLFILMLRLDFLVKIAFIDV